ncbi:hypothetical protein [Micrococcus terreus]|uniref:hypothetical protein n=1 Tax=Micrococcus terreus TaxID=574650 RepID=UPI003016F46E
MQTAVDVVTSIPWTLWVFIAVIVVPIAFHYLRAWRERSAQRQAYERAVESDGSLTELLPEDSRPHVRRLHRIAAERHSVLQPLHTDTTAGATTGRESIRAQLARQLDELPEALHRLEHDAAPRVFTTQERDELADRTKNAADVYERLGAVLTRGVAADRPFCDAAVTGQWERMETLADVRTLDGIRELPAAQTALQLTVDQTHVLQEIRDGMDAHLLREDEAGSWWDRLRTRIMGDDQSAVSTESVHPGLEAELLLERLQDMREETMTTLRELQAQAGEDALPWQTQINLLPIGYGPGRRRASADPLEQLDAAATLQVPTRDDGLSRAQVRQNMKEIRRDLRQARRQARRNA